MTFHKYDLLLLLPLLYFYRFRSPTLVHVPVVHRANATFYMLARNDDMDGAVASINQLEQRFNRKYNYPYVFLNDVPFDDKFKS